MDPGSTDQVVLDVLQRASSQNPDILKPAEAKLGEWETQPGFYTVLSVSYESQTYKISGVVSLLYFRILYLIIT